METLYLLIPLALVLVALTIWALLWAIRSGQFDDLEGPAHRILMDEDEPMEPVFNDQEPREEKRRQS